MVAFGARNDTFRYLPRGHKRPLKMFYFQDVKEGTRFFRLKCFPVLNRIEPGSLMLELGLGVANNNPGSSCTEIFVRILGIIY